MDLNFLNANGRPKEDTDATASNEIPTVDGESSKTASAEGSRYEGQYTYKKYGFFQSKNHGANPISLEIELNKIFETFKDKLRRDEVEQERLKVPFRKKIDSLKIDIESFKIKIDQIKNDTIPTFTNRIKDLKAEIGSIRRDPSLYQKEKPNKISFGFGILIGILLTVYLWIFYTSASYSAFFREFKPDDINVANSIFDATALTKAFYAGIPAFVLVVSMPFIFLALGYLIHKFNEQKTRWKYLSLACLIIITFGLDYIIAYEIVKKVYDLETIMIIDNNRLPYSFSQAVHDINFWLIIFAGFVTYLIWGLLFDKLMAEYEKFDVVKVQIKIREGEIKEIEKELKVHQGKVDELNSKMSEAEKEIKATEKDLEATFFRAKDFEHIVYQFSSGWFQYVEGGLLTTEEKKNLLRSELSNVTKNFVQVNNNQIQSV
ncbi:hypothetical protein [Ferruginibacter sp. HRS2-29]|uniref:hypothetical protein n=1 Tax=Ferruginibacter sp. HRS2-29 TaxID=2487334 RepID=UPI0020CC077C|nr:hypothetical protein [Ferruginibacter sp. HRS2-29]MCP9752367.1 hypothetical protein [Ferruginibacter sp. HRS2-29]